MKYKKWIVGGVFIFLLILMRRFEVIFKSYGVTNDLEMSFGYTSGEVYHVMKLLGISGRIQKLFYYCVDFIFIFVFVLAQNYILHGILGRKLMSTKLRYLTVIPYLRGAFDVMEDVGFIFLIIQMPIEYHGLASIMSYITQIKFLILYVWLISFVGAVIIRVIRKSDHNTNKESI